MALTVDWIRRDSAGTILATTDLTAILLKDSLHVTQALNDEPDTCSFELRPQSAPGVAYADQIVADGATHYWRLNEASGTTASDRIGAAHGVISGGVTLGQPGSLADGSTAMTFDGINGKIVTTPVAFVPPFTIEVWFRTTVTNPRKVIFSNTWGVDSNVTLFNENTTELFLYLGTGGVSQPIPVDGLWHHIVCIFPTTPTVELYLDGLLLESKSRGLAWGVGVTRPLSLGFEAEWASTPMHGDLDEVALYPHALTPAQIAQHYALRTSIHPPWEALIPQVGEEIRVTWSPGVAYADQIVADGATHYWRLNEASGTTASDRIGTADGTISGGVTLGQPGALADGSTAMAFDGTETGHIRVPHAAFLDVGTSQSVSWEAWVRIDVLTTAETAIVFMDSTAPAAPFVGGMVFEVWRGDGWVYFVMFDADDESVQYYAGVSFGALGVYHHVVGVLNRENSTLTVYCDGIAGDPVDVPIGADFSAMPSADFMMGRGNLYDPPGWDGLVGRIDEVAIYPLALTGAQIAQHYALRTSIHPPAPAETLFHGFILVTQFDWRLNNLQPPWLAVQCQDALWRFDARLVTYRFPAQSVTQSIADLVRYFCNLDPVTSHPLDFVTTAVVAGMPSLPAFDVVNQRPSTVMRTLTAAVGGAFYVAGLTVHAWAGSLTEPGLTNPAPLTVDLATLQSFRLTTDATQVRRRVLVEGRRSRRSCPIRPTRRRRPSRSGSRSRMRRRLSPRRRRGSCVSAHNGCSWGTSWRRRRRARTPRRRRPMRRIPPARMSLFLKPMPMLPPPFGWVRVGNQYGRYGSYTGDPLTGVWSLGVAGAEAPYGAFTVPIPANETVEWIDGVASMTTAGINWRVGGGELPTDETRAAVVNTEVVTLAIAQAAASAWPELESLVQDGRYSYAGAQARADTDLETFQDPLRSVEWVTEDAHAQPGRSQVIALSSPAVTPPIDLTVTILTVDLTFPLATRPPRRACTGGLLKPSLFLDLVVMTSD